ncbi:alpha/beta hydrolase family protein [Novosphingobium soli]|uniref:Alpha/beta hydrolase family protein n=1 Tax=Novosphingobium soli TaxID=574956 RepID=A0ABV6CV23_9SPHN
MTAERTVQALAPCGRAVDIALRAPARPGAVVGGIVFSHGANASPARYRVLLDHWAGAGFAVAAPLHLDSEEHPARLVDDPLRVRRTRLEDFALCARLLCEGGGGLPPVRRHVAAGHSYGALVAQVAGGARLASGEGGCGPAPACVIALSPPPPIPGVIDAQGWSACRAPMLCITGTADVLPGFVDDWRLHLASYEAVGQGFAAVFDGMDHYGNGAFGRLRPGHGDRDARIAALNAMVTAFARAWTAGGPVAARDWAAQDLPGIRCFARPA